MATFDDPRYGISVTTEYSQKRNSKTISYVNLAIGGSSSGYDADDVFEFANAIVSLNGGTYYSANVTAQIPITD